MNNNGYTKIPNAIIRSRNLTVEEKLTWMYIASMPKGYQFTVGEACAVLRINVKTWRRCVANLESAGLVVVDFNPGKKNAYRVLTPTTSDPGSQTVPLPNETPTPPPFETRGTHINNKEQLKNNEEEDARARVIANLKTYDYWAESMCKNYGLTHEQLCAKVDEFVIDMACHNTKIEGLQNARGYFNSWLFNKNNRNNGTNQQSGQPSDPRAKLDADAVKAMAALAAESRRPKVVPF